MLVHLVSYSDGNGNTCMPGSHSTNWARQDQPRGTDLPPERAAAQIWRGGKENHQFLVMKLPSSPEAGCIYSVRCCLADVFLCFLISEVSVFQLSTWTADWRLCRKPPRPQHQILTRHPLFWTPQLLWKPNQWIPFVRHVLSVAYMSPEGPNTMFVLDFFFHINIFGRYYHAW